MPEGRPPYGCWNICPSPAMCGPQLRGLLSFSGEQCTATEAHANRRMVDGCQASFAAGMQQDQDARAPGQAVSTAQAVAALRPLTSAGTSMSAAGCMAMWLWGMSQYQLNLYTTLHTCALLGLASVLGKG